MRDLFDRQMEIGDELIDRGLPTHVTPSSSMDKHQTTVVFRKYPDGSIIALMPAVKWDHRGNCTSYMHVGQHGGADYQGVIASTKPAQPGEYEDLKRELQGLGYSLRIVHRRPTTVPA